MNHDINYTRLTPTEHGAQVLEIKEKSCALCTKSVYRVASKQYRCRKGLHFPACYTKRQGFKLRETPHD